MSAAELWFVALAGVCVAVPYLLGVQPRTRRQWMAVAVAIAFLAWVLPLMVSLRAAAQPASPPQGDIRALAVTYADGRITNRTLSDRGRVSWTAAFPRIPGAATARDGLPLNALQFEEAREGPNLIVTIALLYGSPQQKRVQVASVRVSDEHPVRVGELEAFGVKPIELAIVRLPPAQLVIPSVTSASSQLEVQVEADSTSVPPAYRFHILNRSTQGVMSLAFRAYRGERPSISGRPRGPTHTALIAPGQSYDLRFEATANGNRRGESDAWLPMDRFVITSVLWSDGLVEGDREPAADERALDAGTTNQLQRAVAVLRTAAAAPAAHPPDTLRTDIAGLTIDVTAAEVEAARPAIGDPSLLSDVRASRAMRSGMQNVKNAILNDLDEFTTAHRAADAAVYDKWLGAMVAKFDGWRQRLIKPAQ